MGPRTKPKREPVLVPHPDDVEDLRAGVDEADRGEALIPEESAAYVRQLLGDDAPNT